MWRDRIYYVRCLDKDLELDIITHWRSKDQYETDWEPWIFDLANDEVVIMPHWWIAVSN